MSLYSHVPLGHHKTGEVGTLQKEQTKNGCHCKHILFCSVEILTLCYMTVQRIAVVLLPDRAVLYAWHRNAFCPNPSTPGFQPGPGYCCCAHMHAPTHVCITIPYASRDWSYLVLFCGFGLPRALQIAPLKVILKMSLVKMKKFHLTSFNLTFP